MSNHFRKQLKKGRYIFESLKNQDVIYATQLWGVTQRCNQLRNQFPKIRGGSYNINRRPLCHHHYLYMSLIQLKANKNSPAHTFDKISAAV